MSTMPNPPDQPSLDLLMKLVGKRQQQSDDLTKLAQTQVSNQGIFQGRPKNFGDALGRFTGAGQDNAQRRAMTGLYSSILNRDPRSNPMGAVASGLEKGQQYMDSIREREKGNQVAAAKIGIEGTDAQSKAISDMMQLKQADRRIGQGDRGLDLEQKRYELAVKQANQKSAPDPFTLSQGQVRFDPTGKEIARVAPKPVNGDRAKALEETATTRQENLTAAIRFRDAFESGAESGTSRTVAGMVPGVWTNQGRFDQELDSFAEKAARAALKAQGEIRPTDADVKGMKEALFGKGKDENVNKNLLDAYIAEQIKEENAYRESKGLAPIEYTPKNVGKNWYEKLYEDNAGTKIVDFNDL